MQTISILGSTGSIGTQALQLVALHPERFRVTAMTGHRNRELFFEQVRTFRPEMAGLTEPIPMEEIPADLRFCRWVMGKEALHVAAAEVPVDMVLVSVVGIAGLQSVMDALRAGRQVLLANKEALVTGGHLVMDAAKRIGKPLLPVDSEHSAIFQCLQGAADNTPVKLLLTASGGPFRTWEKERIYNATRAEALNHPNWAMGAKITIDSATLMNKGLEFIEAMRLYNMPPEQIEIAVHRESIVHSLVEFVDGAILAQLGTADMRMPIQYALTWPERTEGPATPLDLFSCPPLSFKKPDIKTFRCLGLALDCARKGGNSTAVLNGANEAAVALFLEEKISFLDIARLVEHALEQVPFVAAPDLDDILAADRAAREAVYKATR